MFRKCLRRHVVACKLRPVTTSLLPESFSARGTIERKVAGGTVLIGCEFRMSMKFLSI